MESPVFEESDNRAVDISVQMNVRDLSLFRKYYPEFPEVESQARFNATINSSRERLLITGNFADQEFRTERLRADDFNTTFTASLRHDAELKSSSTIDLQVNSAETGFRNYNLRESSIDFTMRDDSFRVQQNFSRLEDDLVLETSFNGRLKSDSIQVSLEEFEIGTSDYRWTSQNSPQLAYTNQQSLIVDSLVVTSDTDYIAINGTYSTNFDDSVNYEIQNLDLSRISNLLGGRFSFSFELKFPNPNTHPNSIHTGRSEH